MRARARAYLAGLRGAQRRLRGDLRQQGASLHRRLPAVPRGGPLGRRRLRGRAAHGAAGGLRRRRGSTCTATTRPTRRSASPPRSGVGHLILDSFDEIERCERLLDGRQPVLIRVTPGVRPSTHDYVQTGQLDSKFGFGLEDGLAARAIERVLACEHLELVGLHAHIGSQIFELEPYKVAIRALGELAGDWCRMLNVGGGLGIAYTEEDEPPSIESYVEVKVRGVRRGLRAVDADPGRARPLAGRQRRGHRLQRRDREGDPRRSHLHRGRRRDVGQPAADALRRPLRGADRRSGRRTRRHARRRSPGCTASRATSSSATLASPRRRSATSSSRRPPAPTATRWPTTTTAVPRPPVIFCSGGDARVVVRRETYEDLTARDVSEPVRIGLLGHGTVGGAFAELLAERADAVAAATGRRPELAGVLTRSGGRLRADPRRLRRARRADRRHRPRPRLRQPGARGRKAGRHGEQAAAGPARGRALRSRPRGRRAASLRGRGRRRDPDHPRDPGELRRDRDLKVFGIVNGTTNFILSEMASTGAGFEETLARAQELGYAEADPTEDVNGADAAAKMAILARLAFHTPVSLDRGPLRGDRASPARRPRLREGARPVAEAARRRRAPRRGDQRARLPLLPLPGASAGAGRGAVQRGDGRGPVDNRGDDVGPRRRRHRDRLGRARRRRLDPRRRGAGPRDAPGAPDRHRRRPPRSTCT